MYDSNEKTISPEIIEQGLISLFSEVFGAAESEIDPCATLMELGADSLLLFDVLSPIQERFDVKLTVRQFYSELPTIRHIGEYITSNMPLINLQKLNGGAAESANIGLHENSPRSNFAFGNEVNFDNSSASGDLNSEPVAKATAPVAEVVNLFKKQLDIIETQVSVLTSMCPSSVAHVPKLVQAQPDSRDSGLDSTISSVASKEPKERPFRWMSRSVAPHENEARARYLAKFIPEYSSRTAKSKIHSVDVRRRIADSRSSIGFRQSLKEILYPLVCTEFNGAEVRDIDQNSYVDMTMGFGAHLFGHTPPFVREALLKQIDHSYGLGTRNETPLEVAELITAITGMDRVAFVNSGTEAVMNAVRVARATTGRDHIMIFSTSYHGHWDAVLAAASGTPGSGSAKPLSIGIPYGMVKDVSIHDFGSEKALEFLRANAGKIAAVLVEPVPTRDPGLVLPDYLRSLRKLSEHLGVLLIFDEIVTGFRCHPAGVKGLYGIEADIVTYGKTIGGGMPLGVIAGRGTHLDPIDGGNWNFGDQSYPAVEPTFFGGTYFQHPLSMVAAKAVLTEVKSRGLELTDRLSSSTQALTSRLNHLFSERNVPVMASSFASFFRLVHRENLDLLYYNLLMRGVYIWEWRCWFLSEAHNERHLNTVVAAFEGSLDELREHNLLPVPNI